MLLQTLQNDFVSEISGIYDDREAENIFHLVVDHLTGINMKAGAGKDFTPDDLFYTKLEEIEHRLLNHEPIQYIINEAWFYDVPFYVDNRVLIPRPETEELVHWVVKEQTGREYFTLLDIGTGSGCIPITLKRKLPAGTVYSCDISKCALDVAQKNARQYQTDIRFLELDFLNSNTWEELPTFDIIVSNPPYIPESDSGTMHNNVLHHEPHLALFVANNNPLVFYEAIALMGKKLLNKKGAIYVEIHESLGNATVELFEKQGYQTLLRKDMQNRDRMVKAILQ